MLPHARPDAGELAVFLFDQAEDPEHVRYIEEPQALLSIDQGPT